VCTGTVSDGLPYGIVLLQGLFKSQDEVNKHELQLVKVKFSNNCEEPMKFCMKNFASGVVLHSAFWIFEKIVI
jgi:hypothetical protein